MNGILTPVALNQGEIIMMKRTGKANAISGIVALLFSMVMSAWAEDGTWNVDANGNWATAGSWVDNIIPGTSVGTSLSTDAAIFGKSLTGNRGVSIDANRNIMDIVFDDSNSSAFGYVLNGGSLLLTDGGSIQATGSSGAHTDTINSTITIAGNGSFGTIANNASLDTRLLQINYVTGQSIAGSTTTLILGGSNTVTNFLNGIGDGANGGRIGITKEGVGTWRMVLNGGNTFFSGPITINGGTLLFPTVNAGYQLFGTAPALIFANVAGAQVDMNSAIYNAYVGFGSLSGGGPNGGKIINAQAANLGIKIGYDNTDKTFGGIISGNTVLTKLGSGTQTLSGINAHGNTAIVGGTLRLDFSPSGAAAENILPSAKGLTLGGAGGGWLDLQSSSGAVNSQTVSSVTFAQGNNGFALTDNGATSLLLNLNAITRNVGGTLDVILPTGTQSATHGVRTTTSTLANSVLVNGAIAYATVGGTDWASLSSGNLVAMTTYQTGNESYTAVNNIDVADGDVPASGVTVSTLRLNGNHTLNLSGVNTVGTGGILITPSSTAAISGGTLRSGVGKELVLINRGTRLTVDSDIVNSASGASALTLSGSGTTILNGTNTYSGATYINSGTVKAGSMQPFGTGAAVTVADHPNAVFDLNGYHLTLNSIAGNINAAPGYSSDGGRVLLGTNLLTVGADNSTTEFGGRMSGSGGLVKIGTGNLTLSGSNSFTGGIMIDSGILTGGGGQNTSPLGTNTIFLGDSSGSVDATLVLCNQRNVSQTFSNNIILAPRGAGILTISQATTGAKPTFSGNISGANDVIFSVAQIRSTFFSLNSGLINNKGNVTLRTGTIDAFGNSSINFGSNVSNITIDVNNNGANNNPSTKFTGTFNNTGIILITGSSSYNPPWIDGMIGSGVQGVTINLAAGTDEARISGVNLFAGDTTILSGKLTIFDNFSLQNSAVNYQAGSMVFSGSAVNPTFGGLTGSSDFTMASNVKTVSLNPGVGVTKTYSGSFDGPMSVIKTNVGTQIFSGNNVYTNVTTVAGGALRLANANALPGGIGLSGGSSALTLAGGVVELAAGDFTRALGTGTTNVRFTASGGFSAYGANRSVNLGGASEMVTWGIGSFVPTGSCLILGSVTADSTVDFQNPIALNNAVQMVQVDDGEAGVDAVISGAISGLPGNGLVKTGEGTLLLTGNNTYDGTTTVSNGALLVNGPLDSSGLIVRSGAAFGGTGTVAAAALTLDSGAKLRVTVYADGTSEALYVNGALDVSALQLEVVNADLLNKAHVYTVVNCTSHSGVFVADNLPVGWTVDYLHSGRIRLRKGYPGAMFMVN